MKKFIYWFPRIFTIVLIIFLGLFSLDVFSAGLSFGRTVFAFVVHLIPSLILTVLLILAWRKGWIGALGFSFFAVLYFLLAEHRASALTFLLIPLPMLLIALFFFLDWRMNEKGME